jgi:hypothetical protein
MLVLVPPAVINFLWLKKTRKKILIFSLFTAAIFAPPVELAARLANVWDVDTMFPRPFGVMPVENLLFAFLNFFWVLCFYEYFVDGDTQHTVSHRFKYLLLLYVGMAAAVFGAYAYDPQLVSLNYFTVALPVVIAPLILIYWKKPEWLRKTILPTAFFAFVFFVYEMISLRVGSWWWPGSYVLPLDIGGKIFPLDDVIIWYLFSTPALIGGYEFFADDWA